MHYLLRFTLARRMSYTLQGNVSRYSFVSDSSRAWVEHHRHPRKRGNRVSKRMGSAWARQSAVPIAVIIGGPGVFWAGMGLAQADTTSHAAPADGDLAVPSRVSKVYEDLRRSTRQHRLRAEKGGPWGAYAKRKLRFQQEIGFQWSLDISLLQQWGLPNGGRPSLQFLAGLSLSYDLFGDDILGTGSLQFAGTLATYPTEQTAADTGSDLGIISTINDWPVSQRQLDQLTYTQSSPTGRLSISVGQFPFDNFDGNRYLDNQQQDFVNYIFAQNGSATYAAAGLGAYAQFSPAKSVKLAVGFQYPNNASVATLTVPGLDTGDHAWVAFAQWTPALATDRSGAYSLTYYESPTGSQQPATRGWSLNAAQDLDKHWALFGRANSAYSTTASIRASYALGLALKDPLDRNPGDRIGLAIGYSEPGDPPAVPEDARRERVVESYWNWSVLGGLLLTPDVQLILDPALDPARDSVWVLSLRTTLVF
jgi:carbohydrate-selective porin OprB